MEVAVKMLKSFVGPGINWPAGSIQLMDKAAAARMVELNAAEYVEAEEPSTKRKKRSTK